MSYWRKIFFNWIDRRAKSSSSHRLGHKNLYIFPTWRGFAFLFVALVLWLFGTNYQNNLILALVFLMLSIVHIVKLLTYFNLSGLALRWQSASPVFVGESARFVFILNRTRNNYSEALTLQFQQQKNSPEQESRVSIDVVPGQDNVIAVPCKARKRGWLTPTRLRVKTDFPLGLLRCWTWLNWDARVLVYPHPIELPLIANTGEAGESEQAQHREVLSTQGDDFSGVRSYREGDSLKRIAWKNYARDDQLVTKTFDDAQDQDVWLDFHSIASPDVEKRLSALCYWALEYHKAHYRFGLRLPTITITPNFGEAHVSAVLNALATFPSGMSVHSIAGGRDED